MLFRLFLLLPLFCSAVSLEAQDTTNADPDTARVQIKATDTVRQHSPRKATIMSAVLPGLGQAYNEKYWKIPVVYATLGGSAYLLVRNQINHKNFKEAYIARVDGNPNTVDNQYKGQYSDEQLRTIQDTYRRWRDLSGIALAAFYVLNILDASVDAYLYEFDVSDDLSLRLGPSAIPHRGTASAGLNLTLRFKR